MPAHSGFPAASRGGRARFLAFGLALAGFAVLIGLCLVAGRWGRERERERRREAVVAAAQSRSLGVFRMEWNAAVAYAGESGRPDWLDGLRADLETQATAEVAPLLTRIAELEAAGKRAEALTEWKALWAVHQETPPSDARTRRGHELRAVGVHAANGLVLGELEAGRPGMAFVHHAVLGELYASDPNGDALRQAHEALAARLGEWLVARRPAVAEAVASGSEARIAAVAGPVADLLDAIRRHDARGVPGGCPAPLAPALAAAFDAALAAVTRKRVVVTVVGDEAVAQRIRSLCKFAFPYQLDFQSRAEDPDGEIPAGIAPGAAITVRVRVEWETIDFKKQAGGVQWVGDYVLPKSVTLRCSIHAPDGVTAPWPTRTFEGRNTIPATVKVRQDGARYEFDRMKRDYTKQLRQGLGTHLDLWKPWALPAPDGE